MFFKATFSKGELIDKIDRVFRVVDRKSIEPLSNFVFFLVEDGRTYIASSDGKNSSKVLVKPSSVEGGAGFGIPYRKFVGLLRSITESSVTLVYDEDTSWVVIKDGGFEVKLPAISGKSFPVPNLKVGKKGIPVPVDLLIRALDKVRYASSDGTGMGPEGIKVMVEHGRVSTMALDGFCLAYYETSTEGAEGSLNFVVSKAFSRGMSRVLLKGGVVFIYQEGSEVFFSTEDMLITSSVYPDNFPDPKDIKDKVGSSILEVDLEELKGCLSMSRAINEDVVGVRLKLDPSSGSVELYVDREEGKASFSLPAKYVGSSMEIVIDEKGLMDLLNNLEVSPVKVEFFGEDKPFLIREQVEEYLYINLMTPLTLTEGG